MNSFRAKARRLTSSLAGTELVAAFGLLLFLLTNPSGTAAPPEPLVPYMVADLTEGIGRTKISHLHAFGSKLWFAADVNETGEEPWISDGTEEGTFMLADINKSNPFGSIGGAAGTYPGYIDGKLYFNAFAPADGYGWEMFVTDGTIDGTKLYADINPGERPSLSAGYFKFRDYIYFSASDGVHRTELFRTNPMTEETKLFVDINTAGSSGPGGFFEFDGRMFFSATDVKHGGELWVSDGTVEGTRLFLDINTQDTEFVASSYPGWFTVVGDHFYFSADNGLDGRELWKSNGTPEGTKMVVEMQPDAEGGWPESLTALNGMLLFTADDGIHGRELWRSDGTPEGTKIVLDINPSGGAGPLRFTIFDGAAYFSPLRVELGSTKHAADSGELWKTDGTAEGTQLVVDIRPDATSEPEDLTVVNGLLFFRAGKQSRDEELWCSDGTADGTREIDIQRGNRGSSPVYLTSVDGSLYFTADDGVHGRELWRMVVPEPAGPFQITSVSREKDGVVTVSWQSEAGKEYAIDSSHDLAGWKAAATGITATEPITSFADTEAQDRVVYYRVRRTHQVPEDLQ